MENTDKQFVLNPAWFFPFPSFSLFYSLLLSSMMEAEAKPVFGGIALRGSHPKGPPRLSHHSPIPRQLLHPLLHYSPQAKECQHKCVKTQEKTAFFLSFPGPFQASGVWCCQRCTGRWRKGRVRGGRGGGRGGSWKAPSCPGAKSFPSRWDMLEPAINPGVGFPKSVRKGE